MNSSPVGPEKMLTTTHTKNSLEKIQLATLFLSAQLIGIVTAARFQYFTATLSRGTAPAGPDLNILIVIIAASGIAVIFNLYDTGIPDIGSLMIYMGYSIIGFLTFRMYTFNTPALALTAAALFITDRFNYFNLRNVAMTVFMAGIGAIIGAFSTIWFGVALLLIYSAFCVWSDRNDINLFEGLNKDAIPSFEVGELELRSGEIVFPMIICISGFQYGITSSLSAALFSMIGLLVMTISEQEFKPKVLIVGLFAAIGLALGTLITGI